MCRRISRGIFAPVLFLILPMLSGCMDEGLVWTETYSFPSSGWRSGEKITFSPDTAFLIKAEGARGVVSIRYNESASLERLPIVMETESVGSGIYNSDTIMIDLLPGSRRTANNARLGVFETADTIPLKPVPEPGWNATFSPAFGNEISGIYSFTFEIIR